MPALFPGKTGRAIFDGGKGEGGGQVNRGDQRAVILQWVVAVMNRAGRKAEVILVVSHGGLSDISSDAMLKNNDKNSKLASQTEIYWHKSQPR